MKKLVARRLDRHGSQDRHVLRHLMLPLLGGKELHIHENEPGKPEAGFDVVIPALGEVEIFDRRWVGGESHTKTAAKIRVLGGERVTVYGDRPIIIRFDTLGMGIVGIAWVSEDWVGEE